MITTPPPSLAPVVDQLRAELDQIESIFFASTGTSVVREYQLHYAPAEDGCLVSLWDAWNRFMRNLLLTCSAGPVLGLGGSTYVPTVPRNPAAAVAHITSHLNGTQIKVIRGEPQWYSVPATPDFVRLLSLSNGPAIVGAVGASTVQLGSFPIANPLEEIRVCRNFVAHKSDVTLRDVMSFAVSGLSSLRDHVRAKRYGVELFSDWKEGCLAIGIAAAQ
jgi:hypothetical protein